jgi:AhpD family alkylhydroperoxidase
MQNAAFILPGTIEVVIELGNVAAKGGVPRTTLDLVQLRSSQINGCSVCVHLHARDLRKAGNSDERIDTVAAWRESPWFTAEERAALALAECVTRLADRPDPVPDDVWDEATRHYDDRQLAALLMAIAAVNVWNRLNAAIRQPAGSVPV